jgi:signal transduction histidine kinase
VKVAAYYVVAEALTNAAKHARASVVQVETEAPRGRFRSGSVTMGLAGPIRSGDPAWSG